MTEPEVPDRVWMVVDAPVPSTTHSPVVADAWRKVGWRVMEYALSGPRSGQGFCDECGEAFLATDMCATIREIVDRVKDATAYPFLDDAVRVALMAEWRRGYRQGAEAVRGGAYREGSDGPDRGG